MTLDKVVIDVGKNGDCKNIIANEPPLPVERKKSLTDDVVVTSVDNHTHQFHYNPVNEEWQRAQCERLGLDQMESLLVVLMSH